MAQAKQTKAVRTRRSYSQEAVQMLLGGHSAPSVAEWLGPNLLYLWKKQILHRAGPAAQALGSRIAQFEDELRCVERERDIPKKRWPS